ncbi:MAG: heme-binding protein [Rhodospirillaceae bacterium]
MSSVTLEQASVIVDTALARGRENGFAPLTVVVLDAGGHAVAMKRENKSSLLRPQIAHGKAWGALGMGLPGRKLRERAKDNPSFFAALSDLSGGNMVPNPGGVLIRDAAGDVIGAVGISGDTGENDEICAIAGIEAAGLISD